MTTVNLPAGRSRDRVPRGGRADGRAQRRAAYVLVLPFAAFFAATYLAPLTYAGYLSFFHSRIVGGTTFVGLRNYAAAVVDPQFLSSLETVLKFFVLQVPIEIVLALAFALALDSGLVRAAKMFRIAFFIPFAIPTAVGALIWGYLYGPHFGLFEQAAAHLGTNAPRFLSGSWLLPSIANVATWEWCGYNMIILYAALKAVPTEQFEAASIDGASWWQAALHIKVPQLRPAILLTLVFSLIGAFQLFAEPYVVGSVGADISSNFTPNLYADTLAFTNQDLDYAAAISFLLGFVIVLATSVGLVALRQWNRWA